MSRRDETGVLLALLMPMHIVVAAVAVLRLWSTVMDVVYYALASCSTDYGRRQADDASLHCRDALARREPPGGAVTCLAHL